MATRTVLTRDLPAYVTGVAAVGPAYRTVEEIQRELGIRDARGQTQLPGGALATVLGWEFFAPEDDDLSDEKLLEETVAFVAGDAGFRRRRSAFFDWQQKFLKNGSTDLESIERAVEEMRALLEDAKKAASQLTLRKIARYAFRIAPPVVTLALAVTGVPGGPEAAAGSVFLSLGGIAIEERFMKGADQGRPAPTAFVHDARRHFGWK